MARHKAQLSKQGGSYPYAADLPPMEPPFEAVVEILNKDTSKRQIIGCQSDEKARQFVKVFNLVSAFSCFDGAIAAEQGQVDDAERE